MPAHPVPDELDVVLDALESPPMSWQRRVIRQVLDADTHDDVFCYLPPRQQLRLGLAYSDLMEHYAIETMRTGR